ncbi:LytTR family DNA-binding domain-containing protein [Carboxylicivirga sp. M1479]|uniref:LytR/AlgR family response regulator transcription factor n=1 Tax=Carboxylicivirga sp. M1479 TaxID=2594476 RepID=UPI0011781C75|nr:LytTR family DNA-binding domain-containing protein [Carboxylicivirga sp. M1479]TRX63173.1 LytTR family transcriptional regulator [Carboxylicivirga sp. M1479]
MNEKLKKAFYHIAYWMFVIFVLSFAFRSSWGNNTLTFFFVSTHFLIVLVTFYFFNYRLVPKYYLTRRYARFAFYTFCTAIVSAYFVFVVIVFAYVNISNFTYTMPNSTLFVLVSVVLYMLVFVGSFLSIMNKSVENQKVMQNLLDEKEKMKKSVLEIMSNRKMTKIPYEDIIYIESSSNYIKIITTNNQIESKEKISAIASRLPDMFLRIHRSFIINTARLKEVSSSKVIVDDIALNIGRSYKNEIKEVLNKMSN